MVDASALAVFILREEGWRALAKYLVYALSVDHVVKEVANAIWKAAYLRGFLSEEEARKAYTLLRKIIGKNILLEPELGYVEHALEISMSWGVTLYDALYLALAFEKGLPLLTLDAKQREIAVKLGLGIKP